MYNPYLLIPFITWIVAQLIKFSLRAFRGQWDARLLIGSGGMPSAHTAVVTSLALTVAILQGVKSPLFGISAVFAAIVIYDSFGVRRASGEQGQAINSILESLSRQSAVAPQPLREVLGHQPVEVLAGLALGVLAAVLFNVNHLNDFWHKLSIVPQGLEWQVYLVIAGFLVIGGLGYRILRGRKAKTKLHKQFISRVFLISEIGGWLLALIVLGEYENTPVLSQRVWAIIVSATSIITLVVYALRNRGKLKQAETEEANRKRKAFWLKGYKPKKKRQR